MLRVLLKKQLQCALVTAYIWLEHAATAATGGFRGMRFCANLMLDSWAAYYMDLY